MNAADSLRRVLEGDDDRHGDVAPIGPDPYAWKGYGTCPDRVLVRPAAGDWVRSTS